MSDNDRHGEPPRWLSIIHGIFAFGAAFAGAMLLFRDIKPFLPPVWEWFRGLDPLLAMLIVCIFGFATTACIGANRK